MTYTSSVYHVSVPDEFIYAQNVVFVLCICFICDTYVYYVNIIAEFIDCIFCFYILLN